MADYPNDSTRHVCMWTDNLETLVWESASARESDTPDDHMREVWENLHAAGNGIENIDNELLFRHVNLDEVDWDYVVEECVTFE